MLGVVLCLCGGGVVCLDMERSMRTCQMQGVYIHVNYMCPGICVKLYVTMSFNWGMLCM